MGKPLQYIDGARATSIDASLRYRMAIKEIARRRKKTVAALIREACDKVYGQEIEPLVSFFKQNGLFED